jgi:hypothetical protein
LPGGFGQGRGSEALLQLPQLALHFGQLGAGQFVVSGLGGGGFELLRG